MPEAHSSHRRPCLRAPACPMHVRFPVAASTAPHAARPMPDQIAYCSDQIAYCLLLITRWNEEAYMKGLASRGFASAIFIGTLAFHDGGAHAQSDQWTQVGNGVIAAGGGSDESKHHRSGRAMQASWRYDNVQRRNILWIGTAFGGLWKSIVNSDGNIQSWQTLTDNLPGPHAMGAFLVHRLNSQKILVGPGGPGNDPGDNNIYRTADQGGTWTPHQLADANAVPVQIIFRLLDDPSDPTGNVVLAATDRGIFRSTNFGLTWHRVFKSLGGKAVAVTDIVQDTGIPQIWYAAAIVKNFILRSTTGGASWQPYDPGDSHIKGSVERISLAACDANPSVLYAMVIKVRDKANRDGGKLNGVYRSLDRGANWTTIFDDNEAINHADQGWHNSAVACDPTNPDHVIIACKDALETFTATASNIDWIGYVPGHRSNLDLGHGDHTYFLFRPGFQSVVVCNDGGYYIYHPDTGQVDDAGNLKGINALWLTKPQGCLSASRTHPDRFLAGLQDNGVVLGDVGADTLTLVHGSDGGQGSIMPDNDDIMTTSATAGQRSESFNAGGFWFDINGNLDENSFPSIQIDPTPNVQDPFIFTHSEDSEAVSRIHYRDTLFPTLPWHRASQLPIEGLITHLDHTTDPLMHDLVVTVSKSRDVSLYTGPRFLIGDLLLKKITPHHLPAPTNNAGGAHANADKSGLQHDTIYYTTGPSRPSRAFVSFNTGNSWHDVTGNLPRGEDGPDFNKLIANPRNTSQLFLATGKGMYRSDDFGVTWVPYSEGLRLNEEVQDIVINIHGLKEPTLYIATKGRGFWQRPVL